MRILLVNLPSDPRETMFPVELATVAAALGAEGHEVAGFDFGVCRASSWPAAAESCDAVVWMTGSSTWNRARRLLAKLQGDRRRLIVACGPHATLFPEQVLAEPIVDVAILGEAEPLAGRVICAWRDDDRIAIPGAVWQKRWTERGFTSDRNRQRVERLGELPPPDRTVFSVDDYSGMATRRRRYTQIVAGRGSCHACTHLPISRLLPGPRRVRPPEGVVREMAALRDEFALGEFHFEDDGLFEDREYVTNLCRLIRGRLPRAIWQCPNGAHPADLHPDMLEELASAGCYRIYVALHSPSPDAMRLLNWSWDPAGIVPLCDEARRVGIELGGYFTLGLPDESPADMEDTVRFAVESGLTWAQFTPFGFTAGSELFDRKAELRPRIAPQRLVRRIVRRAYWRFYGAKGRWLVVLRNLNRRNAVQLCRRAYDKLALGRPF